MEKTTNKIAKGGIEEALLKYAVPQVGDFDSIEDYNRRTQAYFKMKKWWDKLCLYSL